MFVPRCSFKTSAFAHYSELEGCDSISKGKVFEVLSPHLFSTVVVKDSISYKCLQKEEGEGLVQAELKDESKCIVSNILSCSVE